MRILGSDNRALFSSKNPKLRTQFHGFAIYACYIFYDSKAKEEKCAINYLLYL